MKLTIKQEKFVQLWYQTGNKSEAYRIAYDAENWSRNALYVESTKLSKKLSIIKRLDELISDGLEKANITVERVSNMLIEAYELAEQQENSAAMVRAANGLIKLYSLDKLSQSKIKAISNKIDSNSNTDDAEALEIVFNVMQARKDIKITRGS